jgi:transcription elongation factor Elf1
MIREVPLLPDFSYRFTCDRCGGHQVAAIPLSACFSPESVVVCAHCGWVFPKRSESMENERHLLKIRKDNIRREVREAIRRAAHRQ